MVKDLVSIIMPCYNGEEFLEKTLDSILNQTYKNLEIFFVNDGSTDKTEKIALEYKNKFENNGIKFNYIYQKNQGQGSAVNNALKLINGEFLTWPDSDDTMTRDSIEKRVDFLKKNKEYGLVRNAVEIREFKTDKKVDEFRLYKNINENIFEDLIFLKNVYFAPISYMVNVQKFKKANPKMEIYHPKGVGQNLQMLLPIAYKYKCGYIDEYLCTYYIRDDSHSRHTLDNLERASKVYSMHTDILEKVLKEIGIYEKYEEPIRYNFIKRKLDLAYELQDYSAAKSFYNELKVNKQLTTKDKIKFLIRNNAILNLVYKKCKRLN